MTMTINIRNKTLTDNKVLEWLTLSPLHSWSQNGSDLYTESKEREIDNDNKYYEKYYRDLFKSMDFTIFEVKSDKILQEIRKTWRISE